METVKRETSESGMPEVPWRPLKPKPNITNNYQSTLLYTVAPRSHGNGSVGRALPYETQQSRCDSQGHVSKFLSFE